MIKNLSHIGIRAKDLDASLYFYKEILELPEAFRRVNEEGKIMNVYFYVAPGQFLEVFPAGNEPEETPESPRHLHICLEVEDVYAAHEWMKSKGVSIDSEIIISTAKCRQFWIHDPDGNGIEMMELPYDSLQAEAMRRFAKE